MKKILFDEDTPSIISEEESFKMTKYVKHEILDKYEQSHLKYRDRMRIKALFDTLKL